MAHLHHEQDIKVIKKNAKPLVSTQKQDTTIRLLFRSESLEILLLKIGPNILFEEHHVYRNKGLHLVLEGGMVFENQHDSFALAVWRPIPDRT